VVSQTPPPAASPSRRAARHPVEQVARFLAEQTENTVGSPAEEKNGSPAEGRLTPVHSAKRPVAAAQIHGPQPAAAPAPHHPLDTTAKKVPPPAFSPTPQARQTAIAANLRALLEKQAARAEKSARPASRGEKLADNRPFAPSDKPSEPAPDVPTLAQLPPQIRMTLPNLSVSMLVYAKQPADRFIYINGSKRHEGDEISSGLKLVRITHDGAIFTYRGQRFYKGVLGD
jgi:general secretion pathway protein B